MNEIEKAIREKLAAVDFEHLRDRALSDDEPANLVLGSFRLLAMLDAERAEVRRLIEKLAHEKAATERAQANASRSLNERDDARAELATILAERDAAVSMGTQLERERDAARKAFDELIVEALGCDDAGDFIRSLVDRCAP